MLFQVYQENIGLKKVGFSKRILWDGFNGTAGSQMVEEFLIWTKYKLKDGKILEGMYQQLKKTVKKVISVVGKDRDKPFYNGPMTLIKDKS